MLGGLAQLPTWGSADGGRTFLADPSLQRRFLRRASISRRQRVVAYFRRDANRQSVTWLLFPSRRLCCVVSDLDDRLLGPVPSDRRVGYRYDRPPDGAHLPTSAWIRSAASSVANRRIRVPVSPGGTRYLDEQ